MKDHLLTRKHRLATVSKTMIPTYRDKLHSTSNVPLRESTDAALYQSGYLVFSGQSRSGGLRTCFRDQLPSTFLVYRLPGFYLLTLGMAENSDDT